MLALSSTCHRYRTSEVKWNQSTKVCLFKQEPGQTGVNFFVPINRIRSRSGLQRSYLSGVKITIHAKFFKKQNRNESAKGVYQFPLIMSDTPSRESKFINRSEVGI